MRAATAASPLTRLASSRSDARCTGRRSKKAPAAPDRRPACVKLPRARLERASNERAARRGQRRSRCAARPRAYADGRHHPRLRGRRGGLERDLPGRHLPGGRDGRCARRLHDGGAEQRDAGRRSCGGRGGQRHAGEGMDRSPRREGEVGGAIHGKEEGASLPGGQPLAELVARAIEQLDRHALGVEVVTVPLRARKLPRGRAAFLGVELEPHAVLRERDLDLGLEPPVRLAAGREVERVVHPVRLPQREDLASVPARPRRRGDPRVHLQRRARLDEDRILPRSLRVGVRP